MRFLSEPYLQLVAGLKLCIVAKNTEKHTVHSSRVSKAISLLLEECQLLFSSQSGQFQDEAKVTFYFPSQVSMVTVCNHHICK